MTDSQKIEEIFKKMQSFEKLEISIGDILKTITEQKNRIDELESEIVKKDEEINNLKRTVNEMKIDVDELNQRSRMQNILINGIDQNKMEDVYKIVEDVGNQLKIVNPMEDVQIAHRMGPSKHASIVVRLLNSKTRAKWIKAFRKEQLWKKKIYVNEHLTIKNQEILKKTKEFAKEKLFKFVWVNENRILIRKSETSRVRVIKSLEDLKKISSDVTSQ